MKKNQPAYCYACGGVLVEKRIHGTERLVCSHCESVTYLNSKPCVAALILDDDRILLAQRGVGPFLHHWDIPGGFLEYGEHPEDGLRREMQEELGLDVEIGSIFGFFMDEYGEGGVATLNIFYLCRALNEPAFSADDVIDHRWFPLDHLPENLAFKNTREALQALVENVNAGIDPTINP